MIYLCGGINGLSDADAKDWREQAKRWLAPLKTSDPMDRDYRGVEEPNVYQIVTGDLDAIDECDVVLAMCLSPSWGTAMEIKYASDVGKHVIAVVDTDKPSPWLIYHTVRRCRGLRDACDFAIAAFSLRHIGYLGASCDRCGQPQREGEVCSGHC